MIELPEAAVLAKQINETAGGKKLRMLLLPRAHTSWLGISVTRRNTKVC